MCHKRRFRRNLLLVDVVAQGTVVPDPRKLTVKTAARATRPYLLVAQVVVVTIVTVTALGVAAMLAGLKIPSPLSTTEVAHDHDVTVERLQDVSRYTAASQHLESIIDIEQKSDHLPAVLQGERVVFVAEGDVDATVDFSHLDPSAIEKSADGTSVTVHLPAPELTRPRLDPHKSSVVARDRGLLDRAEDAMSSTGATGDQQYYEKAEQKLADTADQTGLRDRAEANTRSFVEGLFAGTGTPRVTVVFDQPAAGAAA